MLKKRLIALLIGSALFSIGANAQNDVKQNDLSNYIESSINSQQQDPTNNYQTIEISKGQLIKVNNDVKNILKLIGGNATGFKTGADFSKTGVSPIMIFFDTNCPYCQNLWNASLSDENKDTSIYWIPISVIKPNVSDKEGAVLLDYKDNPYEVMSSIKNNSSSSLGISGASVFDPSNESIQAVHKNTLLFDKLGFKSVPLILKLTKNGELYAQYGDLTEKELKAIGEY